MESFNPKLIDRLIQYMQTVHGVTLAPEEANEYLRVYADTFLAFTRGRGEMPARRPSARGVRAADLINSTLNENEIH